MQVLGIQRGKKKSGDDFTVLHVMREFDDYEAKTGTGVACENVFIGKNIPYVNVGDDIELVYGKGFQGKAVIKDIKLSSDPIPRM